MVDTGINGTLYRWLNCSLIDRTIKTRINDVVSSMEILEEGLPQESSLSCTFFLQIYTNDLPSQLKAVKTYFVDDLVLQKSGSYVDNLDGELTMDGNNCVSIVIRGNLKQKQTNKQNEKKMYIPVSHRLPSNFSFLYQKLLQHETLHPQVLIHTLRIRVRKYILEE